MTAPTDDEIVEAMARAMMDAATWFALGFVYGFFWTFVYLVDRS